MDFQNNPYNREQGQEQPSVGMTGDHPHQNPGNMPGHEPNQIPGSFPYQTPGSMSGPAQNQIPGGFPYQMHGRIPVTVRSEPQTENALSSAAMTLGIIGAVSTVLFFIFPFLPFILMSISIVLALLSRGSGKALSPHAKAGLITSTVCLGIITLLFVTIVFFFASAAAINENGGLFGGDPYEDIYEDFYEFYY